MVVVASMWYHHDHEYEYDCTVKMTVEWSLRVLPRNQQLHCVLWIYVSNSRFAEKKYE